MTLIVEAIEEEEEKEEVVAAAEAEAEEIEEEEEVLDEKNKAISASDEFLKYIEKWKVNEDGDEVDANGNKRQYLTAKLSKISKSGKFFLQFSELVTLSAHRRLSSVPAWAYSFAIV